MNSSTSERTGLAEALDWEIEVGHDQFVPLRHLDAEGLHGASQRLLGRGRLNEAAVFATLQLMLGTNERVEDLPHGQIELALWGHHAPASATTAASLDADEAQKLVAAGELALAAMPHTS